MAKKISQVALSKPVRKVPTMAHFTALKSQQQVTPKTNQPVVFFNIIKLFYIQWDFPIYYTWRIM